MHDFVHPPQDSFDAFSAQRRRVLKLLAASTAMATGACSGPPPEKIVPYVRDPERTLPGRPVFYASSVALNGYGMGVLVESNEGRPTKVEGNPLHPASLGATDVFAQAAVLQLWDPARSQAVLHNNAFSTWEQCVADMEASLADLQATHGRGLFVLTGNVCSPTLYSQLQALRDRYPQASWHQYEPLHRDNDLRGSELAFGRVADTRYHFDQAKLIVTLDEDVLSNTPASVRYARDLIKTRNPDRGAMSRIYALESCPGLIGAKADHRLAMRADDIERFAFHLANRFDLGPRVDRSPAPSFEAVLLEEFKNHSGACVIVPGRGLSPQTHALVHAMNHRLGGLNRTFSHTEPVALEPTPHIDSIRSLTQAMQAGQVRMLVIVGGNPAYDAPADLSFAEQLRAVPTSVHLSEYVDETSMQCKWHVPMTHAFEHWSDVRAFDGTIGIVQPIIAPLYGGYSPHRLMNVLLRTPQTTAYETVRANWKRQDPSDKDDTHWRQALREGVVASSAAASLNLSPRVQNLAPPSTSRANLMLNFTADQSVHDGRYANNAWLQEIPRSNSKLTWDNAAYISPRTAKRLQLNTSDEVELTQAGRTIRAGVWVLPTHADECISVALGYGRTQAGPVGNGVGFNAYLLRTVDAQHHSEVELKRTGRSWFLVTTQNHASMEGRDIVRTATLDEFSREPNFATATEKQRVPEHSLYPDYPYDDYKWGMAIDLNACIGCNACTIACQAENNIPVVGKDEVNRGREMHWIRIDRYYREDNQHIYTDFQPVPCMHCEHAPCEEVCPVGATMHDSQGLNLQIYNRCVGTRFCSNNCPYKVRRFNFLQYSNWSVESIKAVQNPEVTVRQRGVMEKCTYCVQRIQRARIEAEQLGRRVKDGEVVTACQAVCPTQAIVFGDLNDASAKVNQAKASPRNYSLLAELNTRPRTTYLAQVTNPNADVVEDSNG